MPCSAFYRTSKIKRGFESQCKECRYPLLKEARKAWGERSKDHLRAKQYEWREKNPERWKQITARCRQKNIKAVLARNLQREKLIKQATPPWADKKAICDLYVFAKVFSRETGLKFDVDHIVPLRGKRVCGLHVQANLRLLPRKENQMKLNKFEGDAS